MRRIGSKAEEEKKKKRNLTIISVLMLGLLVFGTAAYGFIAGPQSTSTKQPPRKMDQ